VRWRFGRYELDEARRELRVDGALRPLQPRVFDVLAYLVAHGDRVVGKEELLHALWPDAAVTDASLQRAVSVARRALRAADRDLLRTHARRGYRFVGAAHALDADPVDAALDGPPRYARSGGVHLAYRTVGSGPADVVLVLGWSLSIRSALALPAARALVGALARRARVVLFDKRGTGASDRVKALPSAAQREQDLEAVLDAAGSPGAVLVGFSEGGPLAIAFASRHPARTRGLALVGAFARMAAAPDHAYGWSPRAIAALRAYVQAGWGSGATMLALVPERLHADDVRAWAARAEQEGASPGAALDLVDMNLALDVRSLLGTLRVPAVVLHAAGDRIIDARNGRALAAAIPGARLVEVPGDDHAFLFGGRAVLLRELDRLVDRAAARGAGGRAAARARTLT
jgi:pimeloyl-ACP methyl ester carboxylesterase/DNA-binding winged helix-turn-helix (wHTH) protein